MRTDELIAVLAQQDPGADRREPARRFAWALVVGFVAASALALFTIGMRPDLAGAVHLPMFWWKLAFPVSLAAAALVATLRLAKPGRKLGLAGAGLAVPLAAAGLAALTVLAAAPRESWGGLVRGSTWFVCPWLIALLSVPAFAGVIWAIRSLAPTRLRWAGAAGGLLAGTTATVAYCVHCTEMQVPFWVTWYTLGMLIPAAAGAMLGPRLLRW